MFSVFRESSPRGDEDVSHLHNTTDTPSSDKTHHHPEDVGGDSPLPRFPPLSRSRQLPVTLRRRVWPQGNKDSVTFHFRSLPLKPPGTTPVRLHCSAGILVIIN